MHESHFSKVLFFQIFPGILLSSVSINQILIYSLRPCASYFLIYHEDFPECLIHGKILFFWMVTMIISELLIAMISYNMLYPYV